METEETFEVDRSRILCVSEENQDPDLRTLGLSVYDQEALELGIRQQVDEALRDSARKRLERDIAREMSCAHEDQEDSAEAPPSTSECGRLRTLRMKLRALEEERNDPSQTEEERGGHPAGESEAEKRVRLGEMTPFGSVLGGEGNGSQRSDGPSAFERYLLEQSKYEELRRKGGKGKAGAKAVQRNKVVGGKSKKSPLKKSILTPKKRRKKETLGTVASDDWSDQLRAPGKLASERTALEEDSGSEYLPSGDSSGDEAQPPRKRKATAAKTRKRPEKLPEDWASDDSDWEPSDEEARTRKRARSKKEVDDGDADDYLARLKAWERSGEASGPDSDHELEGGYRIPKRLLWDKLYNYQKVGVQWLWELHRQRCGGILGDEMGLGKTVQVIAFLAGLAHGQLASRHGGYRGLGPVLVVCPTTVMHQWVKEFHQWWPRFRVAVLHESGSFAGRREVLIRNVNKDNGILVTSYVGVVQHREALVAREWHYVILDEGHKIRNPDAKVTLAVKMFRTPHRLILSGSPMQNSLQELWSLFDFAFPGKLGTLPVFLAQLATPITQGGYANASEVQVAAAHRCATVLKDTISPYLLRRVKADVRAHAKLPPKTEQVLFCGLSEEQRRLYKGYLESGAVERILQGQAKIFVGLINLRKICNHPDLYSGGPKLFRGENEEDLPEESRYGHWKKSGKMIVLESLLKIWKRQGHRVLLFTQSRQMLCILEDFVQKREYRYLKLDGGTSVAARQPLIAKFNQDPSFFVFLLTTRVGGLGVNLTGADRVVVYDPDWNPATDSQARERAWRIGQRNQVTVYRLVTAGTIEEKIYHRQIFKQFLTNKVLQDPKQRRFFKSNDLFELFTLKESDQKGSTETSAIFAGTGSEVTANHLKARRKELKSKIRSTADVTFSRAKVERMKELAHKLSQKIGQLSGREPKKRKPKRGATFEGERVPFLVGQGEEEEEKDEEVDQEQDDYVLRKLFKKSGLQTALRHDAIVGGGGADYALVEGEARKVAREAVEALKESRRECFGAGAGVPTWTGRHGALRARFGKKKSELLSAIENRKRPFPGWKDPDLADRVRAFVAARGEASTGELVDNFKGGLPPEGTPLFKFLLQEICTFHRTPTGVGVWKLKAEFK